jgi:hypothetical protein
VPHPGWRSNERYAHAHLTNQLTKTENEAPRCHFRAWRAWTSDEHGHHREDLLDGEFLL